MRRMLWTVLMLFAIPALAQYPEVDAAREALMAKDLKTLLAHLPVDFEKAVSELSASDKRDLEQEILPSRALIPQNIVMKRSESPDAVVNFEKILQDNSTEAAGSIVLERRFFDGAECLIQFSFHRGDQAEPFQVLTKLVGSEWRVYELQAPEFGKRLKLDDPKFLSGLRNRGLKANEASAVGSMRSYNTAAVTYASTYPDIGYPRRAEDFGISDNGTVDEHHSGLLDRSLTTPPFERRGYRFIFKGEAEHYTVIARPVKYGESGTSSFFTDETGVIRSTEKDEEATDRDEPLQ